MPRPSKIAIKERMEQQGCWDQFVALREQLKAEGHSHNEAWQLAAKEFPPDGSAPATPVSNRSDKEIQDYLAREALGRSVDHSVAVGWVGDHIRVPWQQIEAASVPCAMAIPLLHQAKSEPGWFFTNYVKVKSEAEARRALQEDRRKQIDLIDAVMSAIESGALLDEVEDGPTA